jgi:hypothetical protein
LLFTKISSLLSPIVHKKNLDILTGALAERILFDDSGTQALGVVFSHGGELKKNFALQQRHPGAWRRLFSRR